MKSKIQVVFGILAFVAGMGFSAETNRLESYRSAFGDASNKIVVEFYKQKGEVVANYGKSLESLMTNLKQTGDIDGYGVVEVELKRFKAEQTVLTNMVKAEVSSAVQKYQKEMGEIDAEVLQKQVILLKKYIAGLNGMIKDLMVLNKIDEAKVVGDTRKEAEVLLAQIESQQVKVPVKKETPAGKKPVPAGAVEFKGHHYLFVGSPISWKDAKRECEKVDGHLVTITDVDECNLVNSIARERPCFIGLHSEGWKVRRLNAKSKKGEDFRWVDNTSQKYSFWFPGDPNGRGDGENYGAIWYWRHGINNNELTWGWIDAPNKYKDINAYICEWDY